MPTSSRIFYGAIPGWIEKRRCDLHGTVLVSGTARSANRCIRCRAITTLVDRYWSDGIPTLAAAKTDLKAAKEEWRAANPRPKKTRRRATRVVEKPAVGEAT